jgi:fructosamine-3-kinase
MQAALRTSLEQLLASDITSTSALGGGDIGESWQVVLRGGERCFVKHYRNAPARLAKCEARGLEWLRDDPGLDVARVRAVSDDEPLLVLEWIEAGQRSTSFDEELGRGLAALHALGAERFGFTEDNFIGSLPQRNLTHDRWAEFYARERLEPLVRMAHDQGKLPSGVRNDAAALMARLPELCGPDEPPARLHGDLWGGNLMVGPQGRPCLIDPAVYGGHREMDLAMMRLFGGFSERTFDAYAESHPLAPGAAERVALCQLYPLLVHVALFGGRYVQWVAQALKVYL